MSLLTALIQLLMLYGSMLIKCNGIPLLHGEHVSQPGLFMDIVIEIPESFICFVNRSSRAVLRFLYIPTHSI